MKKLIKIKVFFLCLALLADYCHFSVLLCLFFKKRDHKIWLLTKKKLHQSWEKQWTTACFVAECFSPFVLNPTWQIHHKEALRFKLPFPVCIQWMLSFCPLVFPRDRRPKLSEDVDVMRTCCMWAFFLLSNWSYRQHENWGRINAIGLMHSVSWTHTTIQAR